MSDYLVARCGSCGHSVRVTPEHGGRRARCPRCDAIIEIPASDTSIRLRTDTELTREARAKAGRTDSDPDLEDEDTAAGTRGTGHHRRVAKKAAPARPVALIATLIATAAIVIGIIVILLKSPGSSGAAPPAAPAPAKPPPPAPPPDPHALERAEISARVFRYVKVFNTNDLPKVAEYYTCDLPTLTKAFGILPFDTLLLYEDVKIKSVEFPGADIRVTIAFTRVLKNTQTGASEKQEGAERVLTWSLVGDKRVISSPPEP